MIRRDPYRTLREKLERLVEESGLRRAAVEVDSSILTPRQAIGRPAHSDYPILKGKEKMVEATILGARGHAFTDSPGAFLGTVDDLLRMDLRDDFLRTFFIVGLNALCRRLGRAEKTVHCRNEGPVRCAQRLPSCLREIHPSPRRVALFGLQPRLLEALTKEFDVRVTDRDPDNVGMERHGVPIEGEEATEDNLAWCDIALVTGTCAVNGTLPLFLDRDKPVVFYGVSVAGVAVLLGLRRFCPEGT